MTKNIDKQIRLYISVVNSVFVTALNQEFTSYTRRKATIRYAHEPMMTIHCRIFAGRSKIRKSAYESIMSSSSSAV
jgi:hypothetical protein